MPRLIAGAALVAFAMLPALVSAQDSSTVAVDSATTRPPADTAVAKIDTRPTIPGSIFIGSLVWYPGALGGALVSSAGSFYCEDCSRSSTRPAMYGALAGGGLVTGLVVGAIARTSPRCNRSQLLRTAILGAELGSFVTAGATGLLSDRPLHDVPSFAPFALPLVSAAVATILTRRCLGS